MRIFAFAAAAVVAAAVLPARAQDNAPLAVYKVEYRIRDASDAARSRRYTMLLDTSGRGTFKVGDRVPVNTGPQLAYLDVGVNIDTNVRQHGGDSRVQLQSSMDLSTIVEHKQAAGAAVMSNPTVAQMRIVVDALVTPGKPTVVASIDDPVSQHRLDIEATVTRE